MPRANRYITAGRIYHITHRCHDRSFLLKFRKDRDLYRAMLREQLGIQRVSLLGYCLTSNHVHLLLSADQREQIAALMQRVAGDFAQRYNLRKHRRGAYWADRYHATLVDGERYLWNCLRYIDLNMVRAGQVSHPEQWEWCGYHELVGRRRRYRLIDQDRLIEALGEAMTAAGFATRYAESIEEACRAPQGRDPVWTESLAVGSEPFVRTVETSLKNRVRTETGEAAGMAGAWYLRERNTVYG